MVLDPYRTTPNEINDVWESMAWEQPTGFCQAYRLPDEWLPYETIKITTDDYHITFCPDKWNTLGFNTDGEFEDIAINPPMLLIHTRGQGETPADIISNGRESSESLAGLLNLLLGAGYPMLDKTYEAVFRKDKVETIKYFPARPRVSWKNVTKDEITSVLKPIEDQKFRPFSSIVEARNRIFKASDIIVGEDKITEVVSCSTQLSEWVLGQTLSPSNQDALQRPQ